MQKNDEKPLQSIPILYKEQTVTTHRP